MSRAIPTIVRRALRDPWPRPQRRSTSSSLPAAVCEEDHVREWLDAERPAPAASTFQKWEPRDFFSFEVIHRSTKPGSAARVGRIHTSHGYVDTPGYVAVATNAALKHMDHLATDFDPSAPSDGGQQLMFCNSYHLLLQPGPEVVAQAGGLHKFMNRNQPLITDSGGFQVFSLSNHSVTDELNRKHTTKRYKTSKLKVSERGVVFRSYRNGELVDLTPERSVLAQKQLGADIIIPLDELPPFHISTRDLAKSVALTHRWEARSLRTHLGDVRRQAMLGVIHGGVSETLRKRSAAYVSSLPFDGFAVGGSLGRGRDDLITILRLVMPTLQSGKENDSKPVHLLGVGDEGSVRAAAAMGLDTFDSCYPTRLARHGTALTERGRVNVTNAKFKTMYREGIGPWSWAYIHHLFKAKEPLGPQILVEQNIRYMNETMASIRRDILNDKL